MVLIDKLIPGLIVGRLICGVSVGMSAFIVPLYSTTQIVREIAPSEIYGRLGAFNQVLISFGIFISILIATCVKSDEILLILIFMLPVFVSIIQIILFTFCFRNETATYYIKLGNKRKALLLMSELYFKNSSLMETDEYLLASNLNFVKESGYTDLFNSENWKNFKVGCILSILQQMSGINYITFTSCSFMENSTHFTPGIATLIIGLIAFASSLLAVVILRENYRELLQVGGLGMCFSFFAVLVLIFCNSRLFDIVYLASTLVFIVCFEFSIGPILWVYCADMLSEKGISLSFSLNFLFSLIAGGVVTIDPVQRRFEYRGDSGLHQGLFFAMNLVFMLSCFAVRVI